MVMLNTFPRSIEIGNRVSRLDDTLIFLDDEALTPKSNYNNKRSFTDFTDSYIDTFQPKRIKSLSSYKSSFTENEELYRWMTDADTSFVHLLQEFDTPSEVKVDEPCDYEMDLNLNLFDEVEEPVKSEKQTSEKPSTVSSDIAPFPTPVVDNLPGSYGLVPTRLTAMEVFGMYIKKKVDANNKPLIDASGLLSRECYETWINSRKSPLKRPEEGYRKCILAHCTATDGGSSPFSEDVEAAVLALLREPGKIWPCFEGQKDKDGNPIRIGLKGLRATGFHEKRLKISEEALKYGKKGWR